MTPKGPVIALAVVGGGSLIAESFIKGLPEILTAAGALLTAGGVAYGIYASAARERRSAAKLEVVLVETDKTKAVVERAKEETGVKLEVIRRDVNSNLTKALGEKEAAVAQNKILTDLLTTLNPDDETVKALIASMGVPGAPQGPSGEKLTAPNGSASKVKL